MPLVAESYHEKSQSPNLGNGEIHALPPLSALLSIQRSAKSRRKRTGGLSHVRGSVAWQFSQQQRRSMRVRA